MMRAETGNKNILKRSSNMGASFLTTNTDLATLADVTPAVKRKKKKKTVLVFVLVIKADTLGLA